MGSRLRAPKVVNTRFGGKGGAAEAAGPPPIDFAQISLDLLAAQSGAAERGFEQRLDGLRARFAALAAAWTEPAQADELQRVSAAAAPPPPSVAQLLAATAAGSQQPGREVTLLLPAPDLAALRAKISALGAQLDALEPAVGEPVERDSLFAQLRRAAAKLQALAHALPDRQIEAHFAALSEKARQVLGSLEAFENETIFKPEEIAAIETITAYAHSFLPQQPVVDELLQHLALLEMVGAEGGAEPQPDFDLLLGEAEGLLAANEAVIAELRGSLIPKIAQFAQNLHEI